MGIKYILRGAIRAMLQYKPVPRNAINKLSHEEKAQLNTIIDLLIPSDENFPPPSSLHLIDEFLFHLSPRYTSRMLDVKRLRAVLHDFNISAGGNFCKASLENQHILLRRLERHDPAVFQEIWNLANHSYYTRLAIGMSATTSSQMPIN
jgi:hypothetical protein